MPSFNFHGFRQIQHNANAARRDATTRSKAEDAKYRTDRLEERFENLALVCNAMWQFIQENMKLTEEDLIERVHEIDMEDGVLDGKMTRTIKECPQCSRTMAPRHNQCMYCGEPKLIESAFDGI